MSETVDRMALAIYTTVFAVSMASELLYRRTFGEAEIAVFVVFFVVLVVGESYRPLRTSLVYRSVLIVFALVVALAKATVFESTTGAVALILLAAVLLYGTVDTAADREPDTGGS